MALRKKRKQSQNQICQKGKKTKVLQIRNLICFLKQYKYKKDIKDSKILMMQLRHIYRTGGTIHGLSLFTLAISNQGMVDLGNPLPALALVCTFFLIFIARLVS